MKNEIEVPRVKIRQENLFKLTDEQRNGLLDRIRGDAELRETLTFVDYDRPGIYPGAINAINAYGGRTRYGVIPMTNPYDYNTTDARIGEIMQSMAKSMNYDTVTFPYPASKEQTKSAGTKIKGAPIPPWSYRMAASFAMKNIPNEDIILLEYNFRRGAPGYGECNRAWYLRDSYGANIIVPTKAICESCQCDHHSTFIPLDHVLNMIMHIVKDSSLNGQDAEFSILIATQKNSYHTYENLVEHLNGLTENIPTYFPGAAVGIIETDSVMRFPNISYANQPTATFY
jgi:hypothetical protein